MKIITNFGVLLRLAKKQAEAEKSGDQEAIKKATAEHIAYKKICLESEMMQYSTNGGGGMTICILAKMI